MITLYVHYEIHDEVRKNDKVHNSFIKKYFQYNLGSPLKKIFIIRDIR